MKTTTTILFAMLLSACSSAQSQEPQPVSEPAAIATPIRPTPLASVEFPAADADGPRIEVIAEVPILLDGELMPAGARKLVNVADGTAFEALIRGREVHLPGGTMTLTMTDSGWEIEGPVFYAYPPDTCAAVHEGAVSDGQASSLVIDFGISCGPNPDIGKFAVSACAARIERFHHGTFSGGPLFTLTQYDHTELFVVPPGDAWEVRYAADRRTFAVR